MVLHDGIEDKSWWNKKNLYIWFHVLISRSVSGSLVRCYRSLIPLLMWLFLVQAVFKYYPLLSLTWQLLPNISNILLKLLNPYLVYLLLLVSFVFGLLVKRLYFSLQKFDFSLQQSNICFTLNHHRLKLFFLFWHFLAHFRVFLSQKDFFIDFF